LHPSQWRNYSAQVGHILHQTCKSGIGNNPRSIKREQGVLTTSGPLNDVELTSARNKECGCPTVGPWSHTYSMLFIPYAYVCTLETLLIHTPFEWHGSLFVMGYDGLILVPTPFMRYAYVIHHIGMQFLHLGKLELVCSHFFLKSQIQERTLLKFKRLHQLCSGIAHKGE
jgi:hypothetical protein